MRHYPKEIVWKRTISYFFAIFKGLTNKPIPTTMNSYVSEAEYEEMMDAENAQFGELKAVPVRKYMIWNLRIKTIRPPVQCEWEAYYRHYLKNVFSIRGILTVYWICWRKES